MMTSLSHNSLPEVLTGKEHQQCPINGKEECQQKPQIQQEGQ